MPKIKRILLDKYLNPIEGYNFNEEYEFPTITEAFKAFHELEDKCKYRIDIRCNCCFIIPFSCSIMCWYYKFIIED